MEFLDGAATWFRNARIVTADRVFIGCLKVEDGRIDEIGERDSRGAGIDFQGDYLLARPHRTAHRPSRIALLSAAAR